MLKLQVTPQKIWIYTSPLPPRQTLQSYSFIGWCQKEHAICKSIFYCNAITIPGTHLLTDAVCESDGGGEWGNEWGIEWGIERTQKSMQAKNVSNICLAWHCEDGMHFYYITVLISHLSIVGINRGWRDLTSAVNSKKINGINRV